jgi:hypothetical protein
MPVGYYVEPRFKGYVKFGHYARIKKIIESGLFFPAMITGLSGNGKTLMIKEICAELGRELIIVSVNAETDVASLLGGMRIVDGDTAWGDGPVPIAMKRGAILLLDEMDMGTTKLMCLQPVLNGEKLTIGKTGETVYAAPGFNVFATGNTKGMGDDTGTFIGARVMNLALRERFKVFFDQEYPPVGVETDIVYGNLKAIGAADKEFADNLVLWARNSREEAEDGEGFIATRRLCHIVDAYHIFGDKLAAIDACLTIFPKERKDALLEFYMLIDLAVMEAERERLEKEMEETARIEAAEKAARELEGVNLDEW